MSDGRNRCRCTACRTLTIQHQKPGRSRRHVRAAYARYCAASLEQNRHEAIHPTPEGTP